jgi:CHAT domain-containing protein/tetratricopeptide (TPR) repeat protein
MPFNRTGRFGLVPSFLFALLMGLSTLAAQTPAPPQTPQDVKARIKEAADLLNKRAFADAMKILDVLAADPAVAADPALQADVTYHTGNSWFLQNEYPKALQLLERSLELCRSRADGTCAARALFRITQSHKNMGQYSVALARGQETVALAEALKDDDRAARALGVLGSIQDLLGRFQDALVSYRRSMQLSAVSSPPVVQFAILTEAAITYKNLGNFDEALTLYTKALEGQRAIDDRLYQSVTLLNMGNVHRLLGQDDRALECFQEALAIVRELNERRAISISITSLGGLLLDHGDTTRAMALFTEQLQITRAVGNRNEESIAMMNIASVHKARGELDQAAARYESALAIQRDIGAKTREVATLLALSELALMKRDAAAAGALSKQALALARESGGPELEWRALHADATAARARGQSDGAIAQLRASTAIVNDLRANVSSDVGKIGFVDGRQAVFHDLASLLVAAGRGEEALEAAEAGRARAFADLLAQRRVQGKPADRQHLDAFRSSLDAVRAGAPPSAPAPGVRGGSYDDRLSALRANSGELASLLTAESPTRSEIKTIAGRLKATLVEYLVTERELLTWVIAPDGAVHAVATAVAGPKIEALVGELRPLLAKGTSGGAVPPRLTAIARELNALLLTPISAWLPSSADSLVVIVPHGPLAVLPFGALEDASGRPVIARHTIAFAPSISVFRYTTDKRRNRDKAGSALIVADAVGPPEAGMPPLPGAREEGTLVAKRLGPGDVRLLVGAAATEAAFKQAAGDRRVVHLATHGVISADRPLASALLLAPGDGEDGYLRADEIFNLSLSADLVVLSGCSTGVGRPSGDGVIGLGRAFIYAGTPTVVVSQWDVSDRSTAFLMDQFYASLANGRGPAAALRAAQLATRARYPHPSLWAAFVTIGEPR